MKTLLLLAGRSRRFWPLTEKTLFPVCGTTLLEVQVGRLREAGCDDIVLIGGAHNLDAAKDLVPGLPVIEQEDLNLGMRGALLSALPALGDGPVMIVSGNDVVEPAAYRAVADAMSDAACDGALLARRVDRYFPGGYLKAEGDRITSIVEKPGEGNEPSDLVNIVVHAHRDPAALLATLREVKPAKDDGYELALDALFGTHTYRAVPYGGFWQPVKFPWHLVSLLPHLLGDIRGQRIDPSAVIHPSAVIDGNVVIGKNVRVMAHASVTGPCVIGDGTVVANNALVRGSSVGRDCVVGFCTEVKGSVLADHVWTHMTYIGDSVIGRNVSFGAGSVTGNLRLDEGTVLSAVDDKAVDTQLQKFGAAIGDDCRIGINVSLNPGTKIGAGSFVSSGALVPEDIPDASFARMKDGALAVSPNRSATPGSDSRRTLRESLGSTDE